ncbi:hypothetical protein HQ544_02665 [Candidatus Falkowbacteria bacterium]|nr:hypothetical protein [Candidatus Falkowbacteria bacterium]
MNEKYIELIKRMARIHNTNNGACQSLGMNLRRFKRICLELGIETPTERNRRVEREEQEFLAQLALEKKP